MEQLDFTVYGLVKLNADEYIDSYQRLFDYGEIIEVWNANNIVTIIKIDGLGNREYLAKKYYCKTQSDLRFLLFNGVVAPMFDSDYFVTNERSKIYDKFIIKS